MLSQVRLQLAQRGQRKCCVATRDIAAGEALYLDDGDFSWKLRGCPALVSGQGRPASPFAWHDEPQDVPANDLTEGAGR